MDRPEADESVVAVVVDLLAEEAARAVVAEVALERRAPPHHPQPHVVRARRAPADDNQCMQNQNDSLQSSITLSNRDAKSLRGLQDTIEEEGLQKLLSRRGGES